jgi:hypothetical protein
MDREAGPCPYKSAASDKMSRYFTREQAERMLPRVEGLIREALFLKAEFQESDQILRTATREIMMRGGMNMDRDRLLQARQKRDSSVAKLQATLEQVQEQGCLVKDLDIGLLDFATLYRGQEVYLCWKLGEPRIDFWHGVDEGFRGRKAIYDEFLVNHTGDAST